MSKENLILLKTFIDRPENKHICVNVELELITQMQENDSILYTLLTNLYLSLHWDMKQICVSFNYTCHNFIQNRCLSINPGLEKNNHKHH